MKKTKIIGAIVVIIVVVLIGKALFKSTPVQQVSTVDLKDTVIDFYSEWLEAVKLPTAVPTRATLAKSPILSKELSARLVSAEKNATTPDPVLCQTKTPANISTRTVFERGDKAQVLVTSQDKKVTEQAIVTLNKINGNWFIDTIECSLGEFAPESEFSFEKEGFLLKASIPAPYNSKNWHLVFEENGELGHVVPLLFDAKSQCTSLDGKKSVCKPEEFKETTKVSVHAQMSERGATIVRMEFVK